MKKSIVFLTVFLLALSLLPARAEVPARAEGPSAADLEHWAWPEVERLVYFSAVEGDDEGYRLEDNLTRAEMVKVINRYMNYQLQRYVGFPDVSEDKWYYSDFRRAAYQGYIKGDEFGNANPEQNITRAEMAVIITRITTVMTFPGYTDFTDDKQLPKWAKEAINTLYWREVLNGYPDGSFRPDAPVKRGEAFSLLVRAVAKLGGQEPRFASDWSL